MASSMKIASFKLHCIQKNKRNILYTLRRMCLAQQIELYSVTYDALHHTRDDKSACLIPFNFWRDENPISL
jgi:hypothetical protein